jgi:hypothetical protein
MESQTILSFVSNAGFKNGVYDGQFVGCIIMPFLLQKLLLCFAKYAWKERIRGTFFSVRPSVLPLPSPPYPNFL